MKNKKLAIIGKGTAGSMAVAHFSKILSKDNQIDLYFDPNTPEQSVGEGTDLIFPEFLQKTLGINYSNLVENLDGTYKKGIRKINYKGSGDFLHNFTLGHSGVHFNANKFQNLIPMMDLIKVLSANTLVILPEFTFEIS